MEKSSACRKKVIALEELQDYPCLSFEQGDNNSFYFVEEVTMDIGYIKRAHMNISEIGELYIEEIKKYVSFEIKL